MLAPLLGRLPGIVLTQPRYLQHMEFLEWLSLFRDLRSAKGLRSCLVCLWKAPGWRPDGTGTMTEDLQRREQERQSR